MNNRVIFFFVLINSACLLRIMQIVEVRFSNLYSIDSIAVSVIFLLALIQWFIYIYEKANGDFQ